jgi:hypothetical protein
MTLGIYDIQHSDAQQECIEFYYAECLYAQCCDCLNVTLRVVMLNIVMLSVTAPCLQVSQPLWSVLERTL